MLQWKAPPDIKIYEALGALADERLFDIQEDGDVITAKLYSSSKNKWYDIQYQASENKIMTNDNGSYWKWYLGYPAIALLLHLEKIKVDMHIAQFLKAIMRKDINQKNNNDFEKTLEEVHGMVQARWWDVAILKQAIQMIQEQLSNLKLQHLGKKVLPPKGY